MGSIFHFQSTSPLPRNTLFSQLLLGLATGISYPHFADREIEAQRRKVAPPKITQQVSGQTTLSSGASTPRLARGTEGWLLLSGGGGGGGKLQDLLSWASGWATSVVRSASLRTGPCTGDAQHLSIRRDPVENVQLRPQRSLLLLSVQHCPGH